MFISIAAAVFGRWCHRRLLPRALWPPLPSARRGLHTAQQPAAKEPVHASSEEKRVVLVARAAQLGSIGLAVFARTVRA